MLIRTILYQYIKTLIKHVFLLNFTYELLMSFRIVYIDQVYKSDQRSKSQSSPEHNPDPNLSETICN